MASFEPWHQQISVGTQAMHERLPLYHNKSGVQRMQHFGISSDLKRSFSSAYLKPGLNEDSHAQYHQYVFSVYISMVHAFSQSTIEGGVYRKMPQTFKRRTDHWTPTMDPQSPASFGLAKNLSICNMISHS